MSVPHSRPAAGTRSSARWFRPDRMLAVVAAGWIVCVMAGIGRMPAGVWVSLVVLAVAAVVGLWALVARRRIPVLLNLTQLALFGVAHYQIYAAWGAGHYACDKPPTAIDWVGFTAAHALRAADVLDVIEEYGIDLQDIRHASPVSGALLVAMHLTVDVFLIGALVRWAKSLRRVLRRRRREPERRVVGGGPFWNRWEARLNRPHLRAEWEELRILLSGVRAALPRLVRAVGLAACVPALVVMAVAGGWAGRDWLLWPADAVLRGLDVADAMNVFGVRLHHVEGGFWLSGLAVGLRLFVGLYVAEWATRSQLRLLRGGFKTAEDLGDDLFDQDKEVQRMAAETLHASGRGAVPAIDAMVRALSHLTGKPGDLTIETLVVCAPESVPVLSEVTWRKDHYGGQLGSALLALKRIGPGAVAAIPYLVRAAPLYGQTDVVLATLEAIDPNWGANPLAAGVVSDLFEAIEKGYSDGYNEQALPRIFAKLGAAAVPALVCGLDDPQTPRRGGRIDLLRSIGPAAAASIPALIRCLNEPSLRSQAATALCVIDPAWGSRSDVVALRPALLRALREDASEFDRANVTYVLAEMGPAASDLLPDVMRALRDRDRLVRWGAAGAIAKIDPGWNRSATGTAILKELMALFAEPGCNAPAREDAMRVIGLLEPGLEGVVPALVRGFTDPSPEVRLRAATGLHKHAAFALMALPELHRLRRDPSEEVQSAAENAIVLIEWAHRAGPLRS